MITATATPFLRNRLIRDAIGRAIYEVMKEDNSVHLFGEGSLVKQHYDAPLIEKDFADRVHTLPISEDGDLNFAVGASLLGVRPVIDVITSDFLYRCMDSIANTAAKLNFVNSPGEKPKTIVIRSEFLTVGPTTGQRPEAIFCHIPGLNVVIPSTPRDAYGLMLTALKTRGVTIFFEDRMIADAETRREDRDTEDGRFLGKAIAFGHAAFRRESSQATLTICTYGLMRQVVEKALDVQEALPAVAFDLIDLRTLYPIDWGTLALSTKKTGKLLIIEPDVQYGGVGAEIAATIAENNPVKVARLGGPRQTIPASSYLRNQSMPTEEEVLRAIRHEIHDPRA